MLVALVAAYLLMSSKSPDDPIMDNRKQSQRTILKALAEGPDPFLDERPALLGGVGGNSGDAQADVTFGSLEESSDPGMYANAYS